MEEEVIKNILIELKDNPRKILELNKCSPRKVVEVAFENKLYESLMIAFQPMIIDGEVRIGVDAFSSDILRILKYSCDTKEQAEEEARQEYERIQESNSKLKEEEKEYFYDSSTYESILSYKMVVPKEIKEAFKKMLFTINYEQISKMKIKNCHAREIGVVDGPIETEEDVMIYSELPCLMASIDLFNRNIRTTMNDTDCVFEDSTITSGICQIWLLYSSLSQDNKNIVEELILLGCAKIIMHNDKENVSIFVPCSKEDTVGDISDKLREIVSKLRVQDVNYGFSTMEEKYQSYAQIIARHPYYAHGLFTDGLNLEDLIELGKRLGEDLYYDEDERLIWATPELYQRHQRYKETNQSDNSSQKK